MNSIKKANKLYKHSIIKASDTDIEALAINLDIGHKYGLSVYFDKGLNIYQITRHGQDISECNNFICLVNTTWAIAHFIAVGEQHQKIA